MLEGTIVAVGIHVNSSALGNVGKNDSRVFPIWGIGTKRQARFGVIKQERGRQARAGEEIYIACPEVRGGEGFGGLG